VTSKIVARSDGTIKALRWSLWSQAVSLTPHVPSGRDPRPVPRGVRSAPVTSPAPVPDRPRPPVPLRLAATLAGLEAVLLMAYGIVLLASLHTERLAMGLTTPLFFLVYGAALGLCAWSLTRLRSWARAPLVLAQLIQLGLAWNSRGGAPLALTVALAVVAVAVLVGVFHPASVRALGES
jgi:hypothetical protein